MAITTALSKLRLELGDTVETDHLFNDDELQHFLTEEADDVLKARLRACEAAMLRLARAYDFETDGQSFNRSQMSAAYAKMAKQLRAQGITTSGDPSGIRTIATTVVDGYSDDIPNDQVSTAGSATGRSRWDGWHDGDVIP